MRLQNEADGDAGSVRVLAHRVFRADTPEKKLYRAILEDAWKIYWEMQKEGRIFYCGRVERAENLRKEIEEWLLTGDDGMTGFETVCNVLGFDPDAVRSSFRRVKCRQNDRTG